MRRLEYRLRDSAPGLLFPLKRAGALLLLTAASLFAQDDLCALASLHAASGREQAASNYVQQRLDERVEVDNTGSVSITFGSGAPHTLLIAGLDEPGYIVSGITEEGYLRLERLVDPAPHYQFDTFFQGWPVRVTTQDRTSVTGVMAAPSIHFDSNASAGRGVENLFVDLGAAGREEVRAAGVSVIDAVTLEKQCVTLGERAEATAPWISSRAGAAILLRLAGLLDREPPRGSVTLVFVSSQYRHNIGTQQAQQRVVADRVILFRPADNETTTIGAPPGSESDLAVQLLQNAETSGIEAHRADGRSLPLGAFGPRTVWRDSQQVAVISPGARHSGTPAEIVDRAQLERIARLLAGFLNIGWHEPPSGRTEPADRAVQTLARESLSPFAFLIQQLVEIYGVSGAEDPVRAWIQKQLPAWARERSVVDEQGNLIVRLGRGNKPVAVFIAHMDEIGFEVPRDTGDRVIPADSRGNGMGDLFAWHPFWVHTVTHRLPAVMTRHGSLDIGAAPEDDTPRVAGGDTATVRKRFRTLLGDRITARSLDDRIGCAVLLSALQALDAGVVQRLDQSSPVWVVFSVEEESGLVGARYVAERTAPQRVYPVDSFVTSDSPLEEPRMAHARLGEGFVVRAMDSSGIAPRDAVERVVELASRNGIPYQLGVTAGGNDGSTFVPYGAVNVPLSFPLRYAHTPGEVADLRDAEALRSMVAVLLKEELAEETLR